eukprot:gb/GECG01013266.1/.p1 GENE.gb/GECG01013266.1/~~gb/GECG01013266.1/.p1  ORF type:complete len:524 (+),score=72.65 gb/GECG01013266.1/:1-1572(+)
MSMRVPEREGSKRAAWDMEDLRDGGFKTPRGNSHTPSPSTMSPLAMLSFTDSAARRRKTFPDVAAPRWAGSAYIEETTEEWKRRQEEVERYRQLIRESHYLQTGLSPDKNDDVFSEKHTVRNGYRSPSLVSSSSRLRQRRGLEEMNGGLHRPAPSKWGMASPSTFHSNNCKFSSSHILFPSESSSDLYSASSSDAKREIFESQLPHSGTHHSEREGSSAQYEQSVHSALSLLSSIQLKDTSKLEVEEEESEQEEPLGDKSAKEIRQLLGVKDPHRLILGREPRLTKSDYVELLDILDESKDEDEMLSRIDSQFVIRKKMFAIRDGEWLNDEIVNTGVGYIRHRTQEEGRLKVWVTNSFFMNSLYYNERQYKYGNVRRWTRRAKIDITELDRVVVPINLGSVHWICACIFLKDKEIVSYDSMGRSTRYPELQVLRRWVSDETADKKGESNRWDTSSWTLRAADPEVVPQQHNGCDCGVFMYCICRSLALGQPFDFSQKDMAYERRNLVLQLVRHYRKLQDEKKA